MPRPRRANPISDCPLTAALAAAGGKWKLIIVFWLAKSSRQFGELRRLLPAISHKVLTEQLRELMGDGIVRRESGGPVPAPVRYSLTEYGRSLVPIVEAVRRWGRGHIERFGGGGSDGRADATRSASHAGSGERGEVVRGRDPVGLEEA